MSAPLIFRVPLSRVEGRLDPLYYFSVGNLDLVKNTKYPVRRLVDVIDMQRGRFGHRPRNDPHFYDGAYPFVQTGDVVQASLNNGKITYTQTLNERGLQTSRLFDKPVVVLTIAANIGDTAILDYPACFPDSLIGMTPKSEEVTLDYINLYFKFIKQYLNNLAPQSAQKNINYQQLIPVPIIVPPITVQRAAVESYNKALEQKAKNELVAQTLLAGIDAVMHRHLGIAPLANDDGQLGQRVFRVPLNTIAGEVFDPKTYRPRSQALFDLLTKTKYPQYRLIDLIVHRCAGDWGEDEDYISDDYIKCLVIRGTEFDNAFNLRIDNDRARHRKIHMAKLRKMQLNAGDILIEKSGGSVDQPVGRVALLELEIVNEQPIAYSNFVEKIKPDAMRVDSEYLYFYLRFIHSIGVTDLLQSQTNGIRNLMVKRFLALPVSLPTIPVQKAIASELQSILSQAKFLRQQAQSHLEAARREVAHMILGEAV